MPQGLSDRPGLPLNTTWAGGAYIQTHKPLPRLCLHGPTQAPHPYELVPMLEPGCARDASTIGLNAEQEFRLRGATTVLRCHAPCTYGHSGQGRAYGLFRERVRTPVGPRRPVWPMPRTARQPLVLSRARAWRLPNLDRNKPLWWRHWHEPSKNRTRAARGCRYA